MIRILYFFSIHDRNMDQWQKAHIINELSVHDCAVDIFNPLEFEIEEEKFRQFCKKMESSNYDLFMTGHWDDEVNKDIIDAVKSKGIPTLLICFDNLIAPYRYKNVCRLYDLVWLTSNANQDLFTKWGCRNYIYQPYAANPSVFKPYEESEILEPVFLGTPHSSRVNFINELLNRDIPVTLYGKVKNTRIGNSGSINKKELIKSSLNYMTYDIGRKILLASVYQNIKGSAALNEDSPHLKVFPSVEKFEDIGRIYSKYALCLNSTTMRNTIVLKKPVFGMDLRTFEIAMSGGVMFCLDNDEISDVFEREKEIITFKSWDEMEEKAKFYLKESSERLRKQIRINIRKKAEKEHTWFVRFKNIFDFLGINGYTE